jgi:hypothetical protein
MKQRDESLGDCMASANASRILRVVSLRCSRFRSSFDTHAAARELALRFSSRGVVAVWKAKFETDALMRVPFEPAFQHNSEAATCISYTSFAVKRIPSVTLACLMRNAVSSYAPERRSGIIGVIYGVGDILHRSAQAR